MENCIERLTPILGRAGKSFASYDIAMMKRSDAGDYVSYASHQAEMQRLQCEIDALKQAQKIIIFERVSSAVEKGIDEVIREVVKQTTMTTYKVDPELWRTAPARLAELMVDEKCKSAGLIMADDAEYLGLKCIKSDVELFTAGKMYDFEIRSDVIYVCQDNHVISVLDEHDQWITKDMGAYLAVTYPCGAAAALFKKP